MPKVLHLDDELTKDIERALHWCHEAGWGTPLCHAFWTFRKLTLATDDFYRAALGLGWTEEDLADRKQWAGRLVTDLLLEKEANDEEQGNAP